ncbi:MAG: EI24 domain-containing protein [Planctomycetota bacterium]|nr:EI24 domain-containing protein [Planctomycetota bacterium]
MGNSEELKPRGKPQFFRDYCEGIATAADGFRFLCRYPSLWQYGVWPVLINIAVAFASLLITFYVGTTAWKSFTPELPVAWWAPIIEWIGLIAILALAISVGLISCLLLQSVFCAWAFSKLAYRVELFLGASADDLVDIAISAQIIDAIRACLKLLLINVALLFLNFIPVAGSIAALAIGYYMNALILGSEFLGYPQELRGVRWVRRHEFAKTWLPSTLGLGTIVAGLMLIPIVGALFQTTALVGAVLLHRRISGLPDSPPCSASSDGKLIL